MIKPSAYIRFFTIVLCTEDVSANSSTGNVWNLLWLLPDSRQKKLMNSQNGLDLYSASFVSEFPKFMKIGATVHGILFMQLINSTASCDAIAGRTEKQF